MSDELVDIYDSDMNHLGTATKTQAHKEGLWHKAFHCWIVKPSKDGKHIAWLQLRNKNKDLFPNLLDISAAGHLAAGETAKQGIKRVEKELGLNIQPEKLTKLFTYVAIDDIGDIMNREFSPTYLFDTSTDIKDLNMQADEVDGVYEANIDDLIDLVLGAKKNIKIQGLYRNDDNSYKKDTRQVSMSDIAPHEKKYYIKVFGTLKRYCDGVTK